MQDHNNGRKNTVLVHVVQTVRLLNTWLAIQVQQAVTVLQYNSIYIQGDSRRH